MRKQPTYSVWPLAFWRYALKTAATFALVVVVTRALSDPAPSRRRTPSCDAIVVQPAPGSHVAGCSSDGARIALAKFVHDGVKRFANSALVSSARRHLSNDALTNPRASSPLTTAEGAPERSRGVGRALGAKVCVVDEVRADQRGFNARIELVPGLVMPVTSPIALAAERRRGRSADPEHRRREVVVVRLDLPSAGPVKVELEVKNATPTITSSRDVARQRAARTAGATDVQKGVKVRVVVGDAGAGLDEIDVRPFRIRSRSASFLRTSGRPRWLLPPRSPCRSSPSTIPPRIRSRTSCTTKPRATPS